ncbi:MAG: PAS domain S-box protein [Gemmatimonadota bacterium]|nr:MAG: PAS domain S-box protein [Gemmatimonadota bacterium]
MKSDETKTKLQLIHELDNMSQRIVELEKSEEKRKRIEVSLRERKEQFKLLYERAPLGYQSLDENGCLIEVNQAWLDVFGYSRDEVIGRWLGEFMAPSEVASFKKNFSKFKALGEIYGVEYEMVKKDGSNFIVSFSGRVGFDERGNFKQTHCILNDVTERRQVEEALRESEEQFRKIFELGLVGIAIETSHGDWIDVNDCMCDMFGYTREELLKKHWTELTHPDDLEKDMVQFNKLVRGEIDSYSLEKRYIRKNGKVVNWIISVACSRAPNGEIERIYGLAVDITEQKLAEKSLRESEEKYRFLIENANEGIIVAQDGVVKLTNPKMSEILGYTPAELVSKPFVDFLHPDDRDMVMEKYINKLKGEETPSVYNLRTITKDGNIRWLQNNGVKIKWEGKPATLKFLTDITERKKAEENLLVYQAQLRSLASELSLAEERERRQLATELHDSIGQMLAVAKVKLGALRKTVDGAEIQTSLEEIQDLIDQTIHQTRTLTFNLSPPILYELGFEPAVEWLKDQIEERHGIQISFEDDMQPKLLNDDIRVVLFQAVRELLINVVKHARAQHVKISIQKERGAIRVDVLDDGIGFDMSVMEHHEGVIQGFGLFNIGERLDHLRGSFNVETKPGKGTHVTMIAPLKSDGCEREDEGNEDENPSRRRS